MSDEAIRKTVRPRVLLVDREEGAGPDLEHLLSRRSWVVTLFDGSDLERELKAEPPTVCIVATELDGEGIARVDALREAGIKDVPLVVATSTVPRETLDKHARSVGAADAYLRKPWDEKRLMTCLERLRESKTMPDERLWWLDDRTNLEDDAGAASAKSGAPVGIPGLFKR